MDTYFLIDRGEGMPRWCMLSKDRHGNPAWMDTKGRTCPKDKGRPLAHIDGERWDCTITDVPKVVADLERDLAQRHLLDPWSNQGWISPTGRFYGCSFYGHDDIAHALLRKPVHALEEAGWVRVHDDSYRAGGNWNRSQPNIRQEATLRLLGFDTETYPRRGPYSADRSAPAPVFAVKPRAGLEPPRRSERPAPPAFTRALLGELVARLRDADPTGFLFAGEEPELVTDLGGGNWEWLLFFPVSGMNLGSGEPMRDLLASPGIHLHATSSDQVEMTPWHEPGFVVSACAADALASAGRCSPRP